MVFGHNLECFGQFFERFSALGQLLCTGAWVLSVFASTKSRLARISVHRRVGFKHFSVLGFDFCVQARGF